MANGAKAAFLELLLILIQSISAKQSSRTAFEKISFERGVAAPQSGSAVFQFQ